MRSGKAGVILLLLLLIIPASAIFSLEETTMRPDRNLTIGEKVDINAVLTILPLGQPFPIDHSIIITSDLTGKEFHVEIYADDHYQHKFRQENTIYIPGQFLSYRTSPVETHQYKGSTVTIRVQGQGTVDVTGEEMISLLQVIELDRTGKPVPYAIESIQAPVESLTTEQVEAALPASPGTEPEQTPVQVITLIIGSLVGMLLAIRSGS